MRYSTESKLPSKTARGLFDARHAIIFDGELCEFEPGPGPSLGPTGKFLR
jgi:hypothetical protein